MPERRSKTSIVPAVWATFGVFFDPIQMIPCRARLVTMDETWLYHYDPETKQQSMDWRHSGSPRPRNIPSAKIRWKISRIDFLGSRRHPPHWLYSKGPNYQPGVLVISAGAIEGHFKRKTPREGHQDGLVLTRQCPGSSDSCNPEETGLPDLTMSWSPTLFSGSDPVGRPPVPWTEKTIEKSPFFFRCGGHRCRGKEVYWAAWGVCWINPEFGHCSLFRSLSG